MENPNTQGQKKLLALIASGVTQETIAENIGVRQSTVSRWATGHSVPDSYRLRAALEVMHGIKAASWDKSVRA